MVGAIQNRFCSQEPCQQIFTAIDLYLKIQYINKNIERIPFWLCQCSLIVSDELKSTFSFFPSIPKNVDVNWNDLGYYLENYAEEEVSLKDSQRKLISSLKLGLLPSTWAWFQGTKFLQL